MGDGRNNIARSLLVTGAILGMNVRIAAPEPLWPDADLQATAQELGEQLYQRTGLDALEVTDEVFEAPASMVFDQAENCLHTVKAVMVATLGA